MSRSRLVTDSAFAELVEARLAHDQQLGTESERLHMLGSAISSLVDHLATESEHFHTLMEQVIEEQEDEGDLDFSDRSFGRSGFSILDPDDDDPYEL